MIPFWVLSLTYWLHMLATLLWIGGLAALVLFILPIARHILSPRDYLALFEKLQRRIEPLSWISLFILLATGLFQMSANPNYQGLLVMKNRWAVSILIKHLLFFAMVGLSGYMTWWVLPETRRTMMLQDQEGRESKMLQLRAREEWLLRLSLVLGILILGLTAVARAS